MNDALDHGEHMRAETVTMSRDEYEAAWCRWKTHGGTREVPRSYNWRETVLNYWRSGLPVGELIDAVQTAMNKDDLELRAVYPYFCGVSRNKVKNLSEIAARLIEDGEV